MAKKSTKKAAVKKVAAPKKPVENEIKKRIEDLKKERLKVQKGLNEKFEKDLKSAKGVIEIIVNKDNQGFITDVCMRTKGLNPIEVIGVLTQQASNAG